MIASNKKANAMMSELPCHLSKRLDPVESICGEPLSFKKWKMIRAQIGHWATTKTWFLKLSHDHVAEISIQGVTYDDIRPHQMIFGMI